MTQTPRTDAIAHRGYNESAYIAEMTDTAREMERELAQWQAELSKVMPPDFKDWWQNSKAEWPLVARLVIEGKNRERAAKDEEITILRSDEKRLVEFAKTYRARADDLDDTLAAERALADRLGNVLDEIAGAFKENGWTLRTAITEALSAWKGSRHE